MKLSTGCTKFKCYKWTSGTCS